MKLLAQRDNLFIIEDKGQIITKIRDAYTELKLKHYDGNRIAFDFGEGLHIQETYDDRIFNCYIGEVVINIRDGNKIAEFVIDNNRAGYETYVKEHYYQQHRTEFIDSIILTYGDRVKKVSDGYIIDDNWKVTNEGSSYYYAEEHKGTFDTRDNVMVHGENAKGKMGNWHFLCTVAQGKLEKLKMTIDTEIGSMEVDEVTMTILAKVNFLANPNIHDSVFMNQLPKKLKKLLVEEDLANHREGGVLI